MLLLGFILFILSLYFIIPKATLFHELLRLPHFNYKAQTARRNEMISEKHSFGNQGQQYLKLFLPLDRKVTQKKVVIYYHGGGWTFGKPDMFRCTAQFFVDRGYAVIMPCHRKLPFYRCASMQDDVGLALKKSVELLAEKGYGDLPLILSGISAGGHLVALAAFNHQLWTRFQIPRNRIAGLMLFAPPLDLNKMASTPVIWLLAGLRNSNYFKNANPINFYNKEEVRPMLLVHGTRDGLVNYKSSLSFIKKHNPQNLTFFTIENGTHLQAGFWNFEKNETRQIILNWLEQL